MTIVEVAALCHACPIEEMVEYISQALPHAEVTAIQEVVGARMQVMEQFQGFAMGMGGLVTMVGALLVFITMMGSVRERTTEIGIFRALGFRKSHVASIILREAALLAVFSGVVGYTLGIITAKVMLPHFIALTDENEGSEHLMPGVEISFDPLLGLAALGLALAVGLVASTYPAMTAARMDPQEALRSQ